MVTWFVQFRASSVEGHVLGGRGEKLNDLVSEQPGIPSQ